MIVFDQATQNTHEFPLDQQAHARVTCTMLWGRPHGLEFVFTYLRDLDVDGLPADQVDPAIGRQVVLAVIPHGQDHAVAFIFSDEFDVDDVWQDATYHGQLADEVGAS